MLLGLVGVLARANSRALWLSPAMDFPQHSQHVLEQLNQQRQLGLLCDCTFVVDGVDFKAHKAVLAACSEYFKMLFVDQKDVVHLDISNAAGTPLGPGPSLWRAPCHARPSFEQHLPAVGCARPPTQDSAMSAWVPSSYHVCRASFDWERGGRGTLAGRAHDKLRSEHRTSSSGGTESGRALSPGPFPLLSQSSTPYPSAHLDGNGKGWDREGCQEGLGIEEGANWS